MSLEMELNTKWIVTQKGMSPKLGYNSNGMPLKMKSPSNLNVTKIKCHSKKLNFNHNGM